MSIWKSAATVAAALNIALFSSCGGDSANWSEKLRSKTIEGAVHAVNKAALTNGKKAALEFLEKNGSRPEVTTTASGLQYEVLEQGNGPKPTTNDLVTVHYTGRLIDGTVFDSSEERGVPATFGVTQVIPGWVEALQLMPEGSKWRLYIPSELAYGEKGAGDLIGPDQTLIFDVRLLKVN